MNEANSHNFLEKQSNDYIENVDEDKKFYEWFDANELRFHHAQYTDKDIAYSAWITGSNTKITKAKDLLEKIKDCPIIEKDDKKKVSLIMIKENLLEELKELIKDL